MMPTREVFLSRALCGSTVAMLTLLAVACGPRERLDVRSDPTALEVVRDNDNDIAIIFVHGVFGGAKPTWTSSNGVYWPTLLSQDAAFEASDIYVFNYPSPSLSVASDIDEIAVTLDRQLATHQVYSHKAIIFVCHSMGGLVTRALLVKYQATLKNKVPLIFFYSTPSNGAQLATTASTFSENPQLRQMSTGDGESYLRKLHSDWLAARLNESVSSHCAYEKLPTGPVVVVDSLSAFAACTEVPVPIMANHLSIVKPSGRDDVPYTLFKTAYTSRVAPKRVMATLKSTDLYCEATTVEKCEFASADNDLLAFHRGSRDILYLWTKQAVYDLSQNSETRLTLEAKLEDPEGHVIVAFSGNRRKWHEPHRDALSVLMNSHNSDLWVRSQLFETFLSASQRLPLPRREWLRMEFTLNDDGLQVQVGSEQPRFFPLEWSTLPRRGYVGLVFWDLNSAVPVEGAVEYRRLQVESTPRS